MFNKLWLINRGGLVNTQFCFVLLPKALSCGLYMVQQCTENKARKLSVLCLQVTRLEGTVDRSPCLKVTQRSLGSQCSSGAVSSAMGYYRLSLPIECAEVFSPPAEGAVPCSSTAYYPKRDSEEGEMDSDFEVLMKSARRHAGSRDELNNHKDHGQEKPSRLKQR